MGFTSLGKHPPSSATTQNWLWVFRVGVGFLLLASLLFLLGFFTKMWYDDNTIHYGLWKTCTGVACEDIDSDDLPSYRIATQAFQCLAFAAYGLAPILHYIFYCTKEKKGFDLRTRIFDITYGIGVIFHLASVLIYGLEQPQPQHFAWSYEMTAASAAINGVGICIVAFARKKALHDFRFCAHKIKSKRSSRVAATGGGSTRRSRRGFPHNQTLQQSSPSGSNSQLVFGPREKGQFQGSDFTSAQPNVNVHVHNTIYTGGPERPLQQQYPPFPFATQASAACGYPVAHSQPSTFHYEPQSQAQSFPYPTQSQTMPTYPLQDQALKPSAPPFSSHEFSQISLSQTSNPQNTSNIEGGHDLAESGKPPSYEDALVKTSNSHYT